MNRFLPLLTLTLLSFSVLLAQESIPYTWSSVPITGGGFVPGVIFSSKDKDVRYCRTDMGGAYKWNSQKGEWEQLLDFLSYDDSNLQGVESIAIDPNDSQHVMMACGTNTRTPGAVFVTHDGFRTYRRTDVPFGFGGNENGRGNGERMMISPSDPKTAYLGTRNDGLWRTTDDGRNWEKVKNFPDLSEPAPSDWRSYQRRGSGIVCTLFLEDAIYVAASVKERESIYRSTDGGNTWQALEGQPTAWRPTHVVMSQEGKLIVSYADTPGPSDMSDGAVYQYDTRSNRWTDITPFRPSASQIAAESAKIRVQGTMGFGYAAVAVAGKTIIASTHGLWGKYGFGGEELFLSQDGGKRWTSVILHGYRYDCTDAPYAKMAPLHWMFDIEIDPFNLNHAIVTTGFGGWETYNLLDCQKKKGEVVWQIMARGIEETVPLEMYCPPSGAKLLVGIGDYGGFTFDDITKLVPTGSNFAPHFANTDGITGAWRKPEIAVRVGEVFHGASDRRPVSYSIDGGHNWIECDTRPTEKSNHGHIAVSALGSSWIWTPNREAAYLTSDCGKTWTPCKGLPLNLRTIADKENDLRFYAVNVVGRKLYSSLDGGRTFYVDSLALGGQQMPAFGNQQPQRRGDNRGGQDRVYSTPGHEGDLWIAAYDGLYHLDMSTPTSGNNLLRPEALSQVRTIYAFGFGKGLTSDYPSLYLIGIVNGKYGFFRSTDKGLSWQKINDDAHQYGHVLHINGDMQEFGRVYIGTHGRGVITGQEMK